MQTFKFKDEKKSLENLRTLIQRHIEILDQQMTDRRTKWQLYINQFKAMRKTEEKTFPWSGCSNIFIPELANHVTTIASFIMASRMRSSPLLKVKNYFKDDSAVVPELENFVDFYMTVVQRQRQYWRRQLPYTLLLGTHMSKQVYMNDPVTGWPYAKPVGVSLFQFYTYPAIIDLRASPFVADVSYVPSHEVLGWLKTDKSVVAEAVKETVAGVSQYTQQPDQWKEKTGTKYDDLPPGFLPVFDIYMIFVEEVEDEILTAPIKLHCRYDPIFQRVLSYEQYEEYELPYVPVFWRRDPDSFFGIGIGDLAWTIQDGINTAYNQMIDNVTVANTRMTAASPSSGLRSEEPIYPGRVIICDIAAIRPFPMGDVYPSAWMHINVLKQALEATTAVPQTFMGMADTILKSGNAPGLASSSINQSSMRLDYFTGEFDEGLVEMVWHSLVMLAKYASQQTYRLPTASARKTLFEWLEGTPNATPTDIKDMLEARVEPEMVEKVAETLFSLEKIPISRSRFAFTPMAREVNQQAEQQASLMLSQLVNAYVNRITEFATQLAQLQQQGAPQSLQQALFDAWHAVNFTMRRVLMSFAVEDAGEIVTKLEEVVRGLKQGAGSLGGLAAGAATGNSEQPANTLDLGQGVAGIPSGPFGILGGAPTAAVRAGRGVGPTEESGEAPGVLGGLT